MVMASNLISAFAMTASVALAAAFFVNQGRLAALGAEFADGVGFGAFAGERNSLLKRKSFCLRFRRGISWGFFLPMLLVEVFVQGLGNAIGQLTAP
jgi:hypothetical protein